MLLAVGCGRGEKEMGDVCASDNECAAGQCVGGVDGDEPVCTVSCASSDDCPEGWSCSGATQDMVLVCVKRGAMPFGP